MQEESIAYPKINSSIIKQNLPHNLEAFMRKHILSLVLPLCLLIACGQTNPVQPKPNENPSTVTPTAPTKFLGLLGVNIDLGATAELPHMIARDASTKTYLPGAPIAFTKVVSKTILDDTTANRRYITVTYEFTNQTTAAFQNLTLYALNYVSSTNPSIGGSPFHFIQNSALQPITNPVIAQSIRLEHGVVQSGTSVVVDPNNANLQAFSPAEAQTVENTGRALNDLGATDDVLEYGYIATNLTGGRSILAGATGRITFGTSFPIPTLATDTPFKYNLIFTSTDEPVARVTRGFGETTAAAIARAGAPINATEIAFIGNDTDTAGAGRTTIRLPTIKTFTPTEALIGAGGDTIQLDRASLIVPAGAVTTPTKFKLERLAAVPAALTDPDPLTTVSTYRVDSNATSFAKPLGLVVPVDVLRSCSFA